MSVIESVIDIPAEYMGNIFGSFDANIKKIEQASGNSFEEIDKAVETASKPNATNEECSHAGKVFIRGAMRRSDLSLPPYRTGKLRIRYR